MVTKTLSFFNIFLFVNFLSLPIGSLSNPDPESPKWHGPTLLTTSKLFRQASVVGINDISFNFGSYFLKHFDRKCFHGNHEPHSILVEEGGRICKQVYDYVKDVLGDASLAERIKKVGVMAQAANLVYKKMMDGVDPSPDAKFKRLHAIAKGFDKDMIKEKDPVPNDALFKVLIEKLLVHEQESECKLHVSSRALVTGFLMSAFIGILQMGRLELYLFKKGEKELWNEIKPLYEGYMMHAGHTIRTIAGNGTKDTFSCDKKDEGLQESQKIYVGKVMASKGNVVIGIRFTIQNNILFVQIKEGKLLPFGQVKPNDDWTPVPNDRETIPMKLGCSFILSRQSVSHNQVLTGVQLQYFTENFDSEKCFITLAAHGQKADLLDGVLRDYHSKFFVARSIYSLSPIESNFIDKTTKKQYVTGKSVNTADVPFTKTKEGILPRFNTVEIETIPASAHRGLEVSMTCIKSETCALHLRLVSINIAKYMGSHMRLEEFPQYYYVDEKVY